MYTEADSPYGTITHPRALVFGTLCCAQSETLRPHIHVTPTDFLTREHGDIDAEDGL